MTNLFTRIKDIVVADINEALNQKENKNPIAMLNQYLRECEKETEKVGKLVARQHQLRDEFAREYADAMKMAEKENIKQKLPKRQEKRSSTSLLQLSSSVLKNRHSVCRVL